MSRSTKSKKREQKAKAPAGPSVASDRPRRGAAANVNNDPNVTRKFEGTDLIGYIISSKPKTIPNTDDLDSDNSDSDDSADDAEDISITLKALPNGTPTRGGNQCFLNTALQAIAWLAHLGTLQFIFDNWVIIKSHPWLFDEDGSTGGRTFIKLFEKLLINVKADTTSKITRTEVSQALYHLQQQTAGTPHKLENLLEDTVIEKFGDAGVVFFWLYDCLLVMSGTNQNL